MKKSIKWIGIDFGTTNSAAYSFVDIGKRVPDEHTHGIEDNTPFPSVVGINKTTGEVITGMDAKYRRSELEEEYEFFKSIKSDIGKDICYEVAGKRWTPVDLATEILKGLKHQISERGVIADSVVMAVPVGFSPKKRMKLREAASNAGMKIESFINEPTAAFISNYKMMRTNSRVAVFDWGGGTLDISILHINKGRVEEVLKDGMDMAGDYIDEKIAEYIHKKFCKKKGINISFDDVKGRSRDQILYKSETAKKNLSEGADIERVIVPSYIDKGVLNQDIDYDFFVELVQPEVNEAINCLKRVIEKANLNKVNIDAVLCVGGSSRLKPFREQVINEFGEDKVVYPDKVMWDIAKGAAMVSMTYSSGGYGMNQDVGVIMSNGSFYPLIYKHQRVPCREKKINFASVTDEKSVRFLVTDAEDPDKRSFEQPIVIDREGQGFMSEQFEVSCFVDPDLLFRIRVRSTEFMRRYLYLWTYANLKMYYQIEESKDDRK